MVLGQPKQTQITVVEKKNRVDPTKNGRICLTCGSGITHRLVMIKYYPDKFRSRKYYLKTERI